MQIRRMFVFAVAVIVVTGIIGCGGSSPVAAKIAGDSFTLKDFETVYAKNNGGTAAAKKTSLSDKEKFLDLYINFQLKVKEARALGYDKDPEIKNELSEYRKNLAVSYMLENELTAPALKNLYDRRVKEIRASHILLRLPEDASPEDTLTMYKFAQKLIDSLKNGASFEKLAEVHSQDPSVKFNKGDLYYFTSGMLVPEFEDAAFSLKAGEVYPVPVRTQFGYHIIKVTDIRKNQGAVHVAHIMKRFSHGQPPEDSIKAYNEMKEILDSLKKGEDFALLAKEHSDDAFSGNRGGDLNFIDRGRTVREFDDVIFNMKDSSISDIVKTQFGFHIIKRFTARGIPPYSDLEPQLKTEYQRTRFQHDYNAMVEKVKQQYAFKQNQETASALFASVDTTKMTGDVNWDSTITKSVRAKIIFTFDNQTITVDSIITLVNQNPELRNLSLKDPATIAKILDKTGSNLVMEHYAQSLEGKQPDFTRTMKEYEEGILLFKAEQEHVWNKVVPGDSLLRAFYALHHSEYKWPDRVNVQEIFVTSDSLAKLVQRDLKGYTRDSLVLKKTKSRAKKPAYDTVKITIAPISFDSAAAKYNQRGSTLDNRGIWGLIPVSTNEVTNKAWARKENDSLTYAPIEGGFHFMKELERDPAREKTYEEAASEVSSQFQEYETKRISSEWIEALKKKYPVEVHKEILKEAYLQ